VVAIAVVCAAFDADGDRAINEVRALIRSLGGKAPRQPAHRPHVTLSAAAVPNSPRPVVKIAREVAGRHEPIRLRLSTVGTFGRGDVVWLAPTSSAALRALQADAYGALVAAGYEPAFAGQSDPGNWRPHCTIARRMPPDVLRQLQEQFEPAHVLVDAVATVLVGGQGDVGHAPLNAR
jgi:2'-5' RNA ligase